MSLNMGTYFQEGVSLKARVWADHGPHGDRHERNAAQNGGAIARLSTAHRMYSFSPSTIDPNVQPETYLSLPSFKLKPDLELTMAEKGG
jgi:hypothetical protein